MEMIWHEAISVELESKSTLGFPEQPKELEGIVIPQEYLLSAIATGHGMVDSPALGESEGTCHILHTI